LNGYLLDTNVISELVKPRPDARVVDFVEKQNLADLFLSEVTLAEIRFGIAKLQDALKRERLDDFLADVRAQFRGRVLPVSEDVVYRWRLLVDHGRQVLNHTFSQPDLFIAATAMEHGLVVVTRDTQDFEKAGAALINPWIDPSR
jgi:predicted nucleic acid-binding protein